MTRSKWLVFILLVLGFRLGYVLLSAEGRNPPVADAHVYVEMAANLVQGEGLHYRGSYSIRPPGYPIFTAGLLALTGGSILGAQVLQVFLALLTGLLLFRVAAFYFDEETAWLACLIYAVSYDSFIIPATLLSENLYVFALVLGVYLLARDRWLLAAVALGAMCFTRQESFVFLAFVVLVQAVTDLRGNLKRIAAIVAVFLLFESAWVYRNWKIHHKILAGTTFSEAHLYLSNAYIFQRLGDEGPIVGKVALMPPPGMTEIEMTVKNKEAFRELIARQPLHRFLLAPFLKIGFFLYPFLPGYDASYMFILPFWLLGLYRERHDWRRMYPLYGVFVILLALLALFHAQPRYRGPFYPFMAVFAASCLARLWSQGPRQRAWIVGWGALNAAVYMAAVPARMFVRSLLP